MINEIFILEKQIFSFHSFDLNEDLLFQLNPNVNISSIHTNISNLSFTTDLFVSSDEYYHLQISEEQIPNHLTRLKTMKIHSLSLDQLKHSETELFILLPSIFSRK